MLIAIAGSYVAPWCADRHGSGDAMPISAAPSRFSGTVPIVNVSHRHAPIL